MAQPASRKQKALQSPRDGDPVPTARASTFPRHHRCQRKTPADSMPLDSGFPISGFLSRKGHPFQKEARPPPRGWAHLQGGRRGRVSTGKQSRKPWSQRPAGRTALETLAANITSPSLWRRGLEGRGRHVLL